MNKKVRLYTTPKCAYCNQAKDFLAEKGIEFETLDVSKDTAALQEMKRLTEGGRSVPVISVGDEVFVGFDKASLESALAKVSV
jgi:glutaredoxin 3